MSQRYGLDVTKTSLFYVKKARIEAVHAKAVSTKDHLRRQEREDRDRKLINQHHEALNEFMTDVLEYQSETF